MIRRSTVIVLVVFIVLVFAAWYMQQKSDVDSIDEEIIPTPAASLFNFTLESLSKVQLEENNNGQLIMEKDSQGIWSFIEPTGYEIDQNEANSIAENLLGLQILTTLEKSPAMEILGLDNPKYRIILTSYLGEEQVVTIGNLTPTSSGYYMRRMSQIPVIVSKYSLDAIIDRIGNPPIYVTPTPSLPPTIIETQVPQNTQIP